MNDMLNLTEKISLLAEFSDNAPDRKNVSELVDIVLETCAKLVGTPHASFMLFDVPSRKLHFESIYGFEKIRRKPARIELTEDQV